MDVVYSSCPVSLHLQWSGPEYREVSRAAAEGAPIAVGVLSGDCYIFLSGSLKKDGAMAKKTRGNRPRFSSHGASWMTVIRPALAAGLILFLIPPLFAQTTGESEAASSPAAVTSGIPTSPEEIVSAVGWPFAIVFVVASVVAVSCGIERLVVLRHRRVIPKAFVDRMLQHLRTGRMDKPTAVSICHKSGSPMARVFLHGVRKWGKPSVEIEQAVIDGGERQISQLKKRLRVLNGVATLSPLIGLLGTVIGMIQAFNDIAESNAMGQAEQLARGIALALLTTAIGLFIAIPALTAYMYLSGRIDALVMEMDELGQELVHLISAEALKERGHISAAESQDSASPSDPET